MTITPVKRDAATADVQPQSLDLAECWRRMPSKGVFVALVLGWIALFHWLGNSTFGYKNTPSLFGWVKFCYSGPAEEEHVFVVPFVALFLLWWKREELLALPKRFSSMALLLLGVAGLLHIVGYVVQQTRISFLAFVIGIYALMGVVWGGQWLRATFFPCALLVFCMPLGNSAEMITFPLRMIVTKLAVSISHYGLGIDVIRDGSRIFDVTRTFEYDVAPACSGIRSLVALLAMATIYGFVFFNKTWKSLLIVFSAFPLAILGNTVRITTVILVGKVAGQEAGASIEQNLGFVTFAVSIGGMLLLGYSLRERARSTELSSPSPAEIPASAEQVSS
jgi:exosortase